MIHSKLVYAFHPETDYPGLTKGRVPKGPYLGWREIEWLNRIRTDLNNKVAALTGQVAQLQQVGG